MTVFKEIHLLRSLAFAACMSITGIAAIVASQTMQRNISDEPFRNNDQSFDSAIAISLEKIVKEAYQESPQDRYFTFKISEASSYCIQPYRDPRSLNFRLFDSRKKEIGQGWYVAQHLSTARYYLVVAQAWEYVPGKKYEFIVTKADGFTNFATGAVSLPPQEEAIITREQLDEEKNARHEQREETNRKRRYTFSIAYFTALLGFFLLAIYKVISFYRKPFNANAPAKMGVMLSLVIGAIGFLPMVLPLGMLVETSLTDVSRMPGLACCAMSIFFAIPALTSLYGLSLGVRAKKSLSKAGYDDGLAIGGIIINAIVISSPVIFWLGLVIMANLAPESTMTITIGE
jgi:hypothetical protein